MAGSPPRSARRSAGTEEVGIRVQNEGLDKKLIPEQSTSLTVVSRGSGVRCAMQAGDGGGREATPAKATQTKAGSARAAESPAHRKLVDERDGPRSILGTVREVATVAAQRVTFTEQGSSSRPPAPVEDRDASRRR